MDPRLPPDSGFPEPPPPGLPRSVPEARARLRQLWQGDIPLVQTFWIYYFAVIFVLELLGKAGGIVGAVANVLALAWAGFMVKPIIAAADRYTGDKIWALVAKAAAVVIAIGVLSDLLAF